MPKGISQLMLVACAVTLLTLASNTSFAEVLRIEIAEQSDVLDGKAFGKTGPYERIVGKAYFAIKPKSRINRVIVDLGKAPQDDQGFVQFSADLYVLRPKDVTLGNGTVLFEPPNRGNKRLLSYLNRAVGSRDPRTPGEFGDGLLFQQGYTIVWGGWQYDVAPVDNRMKLYAPVAREDGQPIQGPVRAEFVPDRKITRFELGNQGHVPIPIASDTSKPPSLSVRDEWNGTRRELDHSTWRIEDGTVISRVAGFTPGKIYELVYQGQDPVVSGLGLAAVRDLVSYLKYGQKDKGLLGSQSERFQRAYAVGFSQSAMLIREFLFLGFNEDEQGREVFDGVLAHVAGGRRTNLNQRFAQPSRTARPFRDLLYPSDLFPHSDTTQRNPVVGKSGSLLARATKSGVVPKVMYTNSAYEYFGAAASLIHASLDGTRDLTIPETTRIYTLASSEHGGSRFPPSHRSGQNPRNPNDHRWLLRALLSALDRWVQEDKEPPPSRYPRIAANELVPLSDVRFPAIPGREFPKRAHQARHLNYGRLFASKGVITIEPPEVIKSFSVLAPQVDRDGNDIAGIRTPEISVPLATYTGWNLRSATIGAPSELLTGAGSFIPFAWTRREREKRGDPRQSIEERYPTEKDYLQRFKRATRRLADEGFLLEKDIPQLVSHAAELWSFVTSSAEESR